MKRFAWLMVLFAIGTVMLSPRTEAALDDHPYHFGFKKSRAGQLPSIDQEGFKDIIQKYNAIFLGDTSQKELYLTFDNGYENGYTSKVLDVLRDRQVKAIFFVTGHYVQKNPELVQRMVREGHLVGNHSWSHPDMSRISDEAIKDEIVKVQDKVAAITDQKEMRYIRPPRGIFSEKVLKVCRELGYTNVFWSIAYVDWNVNDQKGADYAYQKVMSQLHPGAVILLHTVSKDNAEALGRMIDDAKSQGYVFKTLDDLGKSA